jgi:Rad3-related DNA helicase
MFFPELQQQAYKRVLLNVCGMLMRQGFGRASEATEDWG